MQFQISRARDYYKIAEEGVHMLHPRYLYVYMHASYIFSRMYVCVYMCVCSARFAVQASLDLYSRILNVIERNNYDNFRKRAFTTKLVSNKHIYTFFLYVCMYVHVQNSCIHKYSYIHADNLLRSFLAEDFF
jgi:hypothetical protein